MQAYLDLVKTVLEHGVRKPNRTGVDTISMFGAHYKVDLSEGDPLLTPVVGNMAGTERFTLALPSLADEGYSVVASAWGSGRPSR